MKKILICILVVFLLWTGMLSFDCSRCKNFELPIFAVPMNMVETVGKEKYQGIFYQVEIVKLYNEDGSISINGAALTIFDFILVGVSRNVIN